MRKGLEKALIAVVIHLKGISNDNNLKSRNFINLFVFVEFIINM